MPQGPSRFVLPPPPSLSRTRAHVPMRGEKKKRKAAKATCVLCLLRDHEISLFGREACWTASIITFLARSMGSDWSFYLLWARPI